MYAWAAGFNGLADPDCTDAFGGTSSAVGTAAGVMALVLGAAPDLGWRDVQQILARTAAVIDPQDSDWKVNGGGLMVNHKYGFGAIDASKAVTLARAWVPVGPEIAALHGDTLEVPIPDNDSSGVSVPIAVPENIFIQHVELHVTATHPHRGDLEWTVTSPSGLVSVLSTTHPEDDGSGVDWTFTSMRHLDELSAGTWIARVRDLAGSNTGTWNTVTLALYGTAHSPVLAANGPTERMSTLSASPNPFRRRTTLRFVLDEPVTGASLRIYDHAGRLVRTFELGDLPAGGFDQVWDGTDDRGRKIASGVCHLRLSGGKTIVTRKIVFIR